MEPAVNRLVHSSAQCCGDRGWTQVSGVLESAAHVCNIASSKSKLLLTPFSLPKSDSTSLTTWLVRPPYSSSAFLGSSTCSKDTMAKHQSACRARMSGSS